MFKDRYQLKDNICIIKDINENVKIFEKNKNLTTYLNKDAYKIVELLNKGLSEKEIFVNVYKKYGGDKELIKKSINEVIVLLKNKKLLKKYDRKSNYSNKVRKTVTDTPIINLQIAVTGKCNMRCKHCYDSESQTDSQKEFSLSKINDIVEQASNLGVVQFDITGGEPLLRDDILDITKNLKDNNFEIGFFTNASLLTDDMIDKLNQLEINEFRISLDGFKDNHNKLRGLDNAYEKSFNAIKYIQKTQTDLIINVTVNSFNKDEIISFLKFLHSEKLNSKIDTIIPQGNATKNEQLILTDDEYADLLSNLYDKDSDYYKNNIDLLNLNEDKKVYIAKNKYQLGCGVGNRILFIDSNGDVKYCPTLPQKLGNVHNQSLKKIWENISDSERKKLQCKYIENCVYGIICTGGCRSRAFEFLGAIDAPDTYECKLLKNTFGYDSYWHLEENK